VSEINGWSPPLVYDVTIGNKRIATQEDVDRLELIAHLYHQLRGTLNNELSGHDQIFATHRSKT